LLQQINQLILACFGIFTVIATYAIAYIERSHYANNDAAAIKSWFISSFANSSSSFCCTGNLVDCHILEFPLAIHCSYGLA